MQTNSSETPRCDKCGAKVDNLHRALPVAQKDGFITPSLTTDAAVVRKNKSQEHEVLMIVRGHNPDKGKLAFPGGFVEYNEDPMLGCLRELKEETNLVGEIPTIINVYGSPTRDPRKHVVTIFYHVHVNDYSTLKAADDAAHAEFLTLDYLIKNSDKLAFDHRTLLHDLIGYLKKSNL